MTSTLENEKEIENLKEQIEPIIEAFGPITPYINWIYIATSVVLFIIAVLTVAGINWKKLIRRAVGNAVNDEIKVAVNESMKEQFNSIKSSFMESTKQEIIKFAKILVLFDSKKYDQVLSEYGWREDITDLREEESTLRRTIIKSLDLSSVSVDVRKRQAWEAVSELIRNDPDPENITLYLSIGTKGRYYDELKQYIELNHEAIEKSDDSIDRAITVYRRLGNYKKAKEFLDKLSDESKNSLFSVISRGTIHRDLGEFDKAHAEMRPTVEELKNRSENERPKGWHRLYNTYIANCIDTNHQKLGKEVALEFIQWSRLGPVELFTMARLALRLPEGDNERPKLVDAIRKRIPDVRPGEALVKCQAILSYIDGDLNEAISIIDDAIEAIDEESKDADEKKYFYNCLKGDLYLRNTDPGSADKVLNGVAFQTRNGEAKYLLATAYALKNDDKEAGRWALAAVKEQPRWKAIIRDNETLRNLPTIIQMLAQND